MNRPIPTLRIGSHAAMSLDIEHVRVFAEDAEAFRGVIAARAALVEKQITRFFAPHRQGEGLCDYTGSSIAIEWFGFILELNFGRAQHGGDRPRA